MENAGKEKKDKEFIWIALVLSVFSWIPILNISIILPVAMFLIIKQFLLIRKHPDKYGGMVLVALVFIWLVVQLVFAARGLFLSFYGS